MLTKDWQIPKVFDFLGSGRNSKGGMGGGDGGIRTLDTRYAYGSLAGNWFQPLTHVSATQSWLRAAAYSRRIRALQAWIGNFLV